MSLLTKRVGLWEAVTCNSQVLRKTVNKWRMARMRNKSNWQTSMGCIRTCSWLISDRRLSKPNQNSKHVNKNRIQHRSTLLDSKKKIKTLMPHSIGIVRRFKAWLSISFQARRDMAQEVLIEKCRTRRSVQLLMEAWKFKKRRGLNLVLLSSLVAQIHLDLAVQDLLQRLVSVET